MYDEERANKVKKFLSKLKLSKDRFAGKYLELIPWQEELIDNVYGTITDKGIRQYQSVYVELTKKQGKSSLMSGLALYGLFADGVSGAEVYIAAADVGQARLIYDEARNMILSNPTLLKNCKIVDSAKKIIVKSTNSVLQVLSSDAPSKSGLNASLVIMDEIWTHQKRDLYDMLYFGSGSARTEPLFITLTNAGKSNVHFSKELHDFNLKVRDGIVEDPSRYVVIYGIDKDDDWKLEDNWIKANPSLNYTISMDAIRKEYRDAINDQTMCDKFRQLRLGQWISSHDCWIPITLWDTLPNKIDYQKLIKKDCYAGLDLSSTTDLSSLALIVPDDDMLNLIVYSWLPEDGIEEKERIDNVDYRQHVRNGWLELTPGSVIDYEYIAKRIKEISAIYNLRGLYYDRHNSSMLVQALSNEGLPVFPFGQGTVSMSQPCKNFYASLISKKINHGGNKLLRLAASNVVAERDAHDNISLTKSKSTGRIDPIVATIDAMGCYEKFCLQNSKSVYETRGIRTI